MKRLLLVALLILLPLDTWAATVVHRQATADTGATPNTSAAFTPALDDLLVVCVQASATVQATATLTSSVGTTFTQIIRATSATNVDSHYCLVADALVSNAASQTVTFDVAADPATGTVIIVESITGMSRTGLSAIRQSAKQDNQAAATTPAPAFAAAALTENPTIGMVGNDSNPAGLTAPTNWTERADTGYSTPTSGGELVTRDSGFTGQTITWGSTSATAYGDIILEMDTSAAPATCSTFIALTGAGCK